MDTQTHTYIKVNDHLVPAAAKSLNDDQATGLGECKK